MRLLLILCLLVLTTARADDLDDGIALDEPVKDDLKSDLNVEFIKRSAKAKSKSGNCGTGNIIIQAGAKVGDIINVSENKGNTSFCGR